MKHIIIVIAMFSVLLSAEAQNAKYDGEWYYSFTGFCGPTFGLIQESGVEVFRIVTNDGETTIRNKVRMPCYTYFKYRDAVVTRCDDYALEWNIETARFPTIDKTTMVTTYYYSAVLSHGKIEVTVSATSREWNSSGVLIKSESFSRDGFTLYKDGNDW